MLLLATKTHWSEAEILAMPMARMQFYVSRLTLKDDEFRRYLSELLER